jgi:signal transduction histidine kinase
MKQSTLTLLSVLFVLLIALFQGYLVYNLYVLKKKDLEKELDTILNVAYREDLDIRISKTKNQEEKLPRVFKESDEDKPADEDVLVFYNLDEKNQIKKNNITVLLNIALAEYANAQEPLNICTLDSLVSNLLKGRKINADFYLQIIDKEKNIIHKSKEKELSKTFVIRSQPVSLNFDKTELLELVLENPQGVIFQRLYLAILSCLFFSLFCIYAIWKLQRIFSKQRKLSALKNDFFSQVSHELKRPLNQIFMSVSTLSDMEVIPKENKKYKYLEIAQQASDDILEKINMIMALSMEEEGVFQINRGDFDLIETLLPIVERFEATASKPTRIEIENLLPQAIIQADQAHFLQSIMNLIENAIKYSGDSVEIKISIYRDGNYFVVAVKDNGIGIDQKHLAALFDKYNRIDTSDNQEFGYGIGLNYVQKIIEKHAGYVKVNSELGLGSEFFLYLSA